ncbi:MAB_1171c family putative transporter [Streptomyces marianii]|uniref:DUF6545 domain-containing protein n=1 Tax=Streptomyces marianii TaxID=1817406 RepID=A0A5R9E8A9_9ACTN|nr:MAB_1171c family putative transporter [Streptomyces marianii]TLQ46320.1 hypothetical protein FEF34_28045 [Streptomyces marianii]
MSEGASNVVYLVMSVASLGIAIWKLAACLRDPTPTLFLTTTNFLVAAAVYAMATPSIYLAIGEALGRPSFATLPVYVGIVTCFAHLHLITLLWSPREERTAGGARRRVTSWTVAYVVAAALMVVTFSTAELTKPADPLKFNTDYAHDPAILLFLTIFLSTLSCTTLSTWRECRGLKLRDTRMQHALRSFGIAMLFVFGYVVCSAPAIALAATGSHALDGIGLLGSTFGVVGALIAYYGLTGAAISAWLRERRDIRALQPLWNLVVEGVDPDLAFSASSARSHRLATNVTFNLHRRVIEILDGIRALRPWVTSEAAEAVYALHQRGLAQQQANEAGLTDRELQAVATAAALLDASERHHAARRSYPFLDHVGRPQEPSGPSAPLPGEDTPAADERDRLLLVAGVLNDPLIAAALREVRAGRSEAAAGRP